MEGSVEQAKGSSRTADLVEDESRAEAKAYYEDSHRPPLLFDRPRAVQPVLALLVPAAFGAFCGWLLGVSKVGYLVAAIPVAILGGVAAGFEHRNSREGALRGFVGGAVFGGFIVLVHELTGKEAKAHIPDPPIVLAAVTALVGAGLGAVGAGWRSDAEEKGRFFTFSAISPGELGGMASALVLLGSLWLPWYGTSESNPHSVLHGAGGPGHLGETVTAWQTFRILDILLVAACLAPFILSWILARGHALTWKPGELTMIVGMTAFILVLCNGVVLGKPKNPGESGSVEISLQIGYLVAVLATIGLVVSGYLRQAVYTDVKKPPGVL
jgi:FtsH-binding integral membrane protein